MLSREISAESSKGDRVDEAMAEKDGKRKKKREGLESTKKRCYSERTCDCRKSGDDKKKFDIDKRSYFERRCGSENSNNDKRKRFYARGSYDYENSGDGKKNCEREKRFYVRGSGGYKNSNDGKKNSDIEKSFYSRESGDCERMGKSCSSNYSGEGSCPPGNNGVAMEEAEVESIEHLRVPPRV